MSIRSISRLDFTEAIPHTQRLVGSDGQWWQIFGNHSGNGPPTLLVERPGNMISPEEIYWDEELGIVDEHEHPIEELNHKDARIEPV